MDEAYGHLTTATETAFILFSYPMRSVCTLVFSYKTRRNFKLRNFNTILDICLILSTFTWVGRYAQLHIVED